MKKTKSFLSIFFVFVFFGTFASANLINPSKVSALSSNELASRAHNILKLEAFKKCVNDSLKWTGIDKGKGPFDVSFVAGGSLGAIDKAVGYGVEKQDGRWDCGSPSGDREDQYFKLLLRNGSEDKYYTGWDSGSYRYNGADNKNVKDVVGDDNPQLYFINPDNKENYNLNQRNDAIDSASLAHSKVNKQINLSIEKQEEGLDNKEKSAMLYASLADTFFSNEACNSDVVDQNDSGEKVKIGDKWYSLPDNAVEKDYAVGHGAYGWGSTGVATCESIGKKMDRHVADYLSVTKEKDAIPPGSTNGTAGDPASTTNDVESQCALSANLITWVMCPLIEGFTLAVETLDTQITNLLNIDTDQYFGDDDTGQGFKQVWTSIRTISVGILVILALVMIISTAISMGPFDAYTVKKVMPRLLIVIVLIAISWPLVIFLIEMSNALGFAVRGLIQAPFVNQGIVKVNGGEATVAGVALLGGGFALGLPGLLSFLVTAFLAVMIAFLVLILRQILVVLLAVIAPIALVSFILPNTSKFGKFWWDSFSKALIAFPIISGFIAIGRVFASVAYQVGGPISGYIAFIAYFAPYFLIPQAFKMAGGVLGNLSGMVNDRGRGAFDRLKNFRQGQTKKNWENTQNQMRFNPKGKLNGLNKYAQFGAMAATGKGGVDARKWKERIGMQAAIAETNEAEHLLSDNELVKAGAVDDAILDSAVKDSSRAEIEARLEKTGRWGKAGSADMQRGVALVEAIQKQGSSGSIKIAAAIAHAATGTGGSSVELLEEAYNASEGNQFILNKIIAAQKSASERSQRFEHSAIGHTDLEASARAIGAIRSDSSLSDAEKNQRIEAIKGDLYDKAITAGGTQRMAQTKPAYFEDVMDNLADRFNAAKDSGDIDGAAELGAQIKSFRDSMNGAPEGNKQQIMTMLDKVGVRIDKVNDDTGQAYSVDEQLGYILTGTSMDAPIPVGTASEASQQITQKIRATAGAYDAGGSSLTEAQINEMRRRGGGNDPVPK